jgi:hypothetical protein
MGKKVERVGVEGDIHGGIGRRFGTNNIQLFELEWDIDF